MTRSRVRSLLGGVFLVSLVAICWPIQRGGLFGVVLVNGGSMEPTMSPHDVVIISRTDRLRVGDVVAFRVPDQVGADQLVIHRITSIDTSGLTTRGDHNSWDDPWRTPQANVLGHAVVWSGAVRGIAQRLLQPGWMAALIGLLAASVAFGSTGDDELDLDGGGADEGDPLESSREKVHVRVDRCR